MPLSCTSYKSSSLANNIHYATTPLLYVHNTDKCITIPEIHPYEVKTTYQI